MALATRGLAPPFSCICLSRSDRSLISSTESTFVGSAATVMSEERSVTEDSQFSSSV